MPKRRYAYKTHFTLPGQTAAMSGDLVAVACYGHGRRHRSTRPRETTCGNCMKTLAWKKAMQAIIKRSGRLG